MKAVQVASDKKYIVSQLIWNKAKTGVSAKDGDERIVFTSHPAWLAPSFPNIKYSLGYKDEPGGAVLLYVTPNTGLFPFVFTGFVHKPNEAPKPRQVNKSWNGEAWMETQATAKFRSTSPDLNGLEVIANLVLASGRDFLVEDQNGNMDVSPGKSKKAQFLVDFLVGTGLFEETLPYEHNPLPKWHKAAKKLARPLNLLFEKGYVTKILPLDEFSEEPEENDEDFSEDDENETDAPWDEEDTTEEVDELEGFDD